MTGVGEQATAGRASTALALAAILVAVFAAFAPALEASFVNWDDEANVIDNDRFRGLGADNLEWMFTEAYGGPYMPLTWLSLAADHALWGLGEGLAPPEAPLFHRTNVLLHALGAVALFFLARSLLRRALPAARASELTAASLLAALLFAVHPLRVESVAWVTERRDVLSGPFFALAVLAWLRAAPSREPPRLVRGPALLAALAGVGAVLLWFSSVDFGERALAWRGPGAAGLAGAVLLLVACAWFAGRGAAVDDAPRRGRLLVLAAALLALSFLAKAIGVTLPLVLLVLDAWPLRRLTRGSAVALVVEKLPLFALSAVFGALAMWGQAQLPETMPDWSQHTLGMRLVQALYGLFYYPARTLVPVGLVPMVELPAELRLADPRFLIPAVTVLGTGVLLVLRRRAWPAALVGALAFAILVAPVLGLTQAGSQLVADRYSYLSCMPLALLAAGGWLVWRRASRPAVPIAVAVLACAVSGALTWRQTTYWRDSEALWAHMIDVEPDSGLPHLLLGMLRYREGQEADAEARPALFEEARAEFARGFELSWAPYPHYLGVYGALLIDMQRPADALGVLERFVGYRPDDAIGRTNLGASLYMVGRPAEAVVQLERAVQGHPDYVKGWMHLGFAYEAAGRKQDALRAFERVLASWPHYGPARKQVRALREGA